ncbi:hypothetical protein [Nostoc sp. TCL26-01]|uniref:hypothetical protein n=1 Tax=Nostoc sp. TCL26-01 TaxID=2576904 RepID=UPI001C4C9086|nr:hypothetical protein [Nostoc sp. TCL26-01]
MTIDYYPFPFLTPLRVLLVLTAYLRKANSCCGPEVHTVLSLKIEIVEKNASITSWSSKPG